MRTLVIILLSTKKKIKIVKIKNVQRKNSFISLEEFGNDIPSCVRSINDWCFSGCISLSSVTISSNVTSLGKGCFSWCSSLSSVTISFSVISIGGYCFYRCNSLSCVTIQSNLTLFGDYCFPTNIVINRE
ncbi:hypothetical protein EIN_440030 [Entamoeba invadens IP1]|uniref:Leucine rich repeat containing protein BspA family protein n=1 Tax=Entamoeba invadens IP1 TaxID=370355 RepID=A0A0A1TUS4_ENTIV|nr:hypothetical protein EIN_440030 [Entamoeba invadens IP1]ELP83889.1 hypothetical protein EIN_440030 [Entamoeba invadens IP1]|eukprot:XP_004183235.1 hypothetical protein EIN_440030 [Entamoeba invadens IP1]